MLQWDIKNYGLLFFFQDVSIPQKSTLVSSYIQFTAHQLCASNDACDGIVSLDILVENCVACYGFGTNQFNITNRVYSTLSANWDPPNWSISSESGSAQRTPDFGYVMNSVFTPDQLADEMDVVVLIRRSALSSSSFARIAQTGRVGISPELILHYSTDQGPHPH